MNLIPLSESEMTGCPFPYFDEDEKPAETYKVYHDGGHYIATLCCRSKLKPSKNRNRTRDELDELFDSLYATAMQDGLKADELAARIKAGILLLFPDYDNLDVYIADRLVRKQRNLYARKKRFRRKANLNRWNYFVTFTYDDEKQDESTFRKRLRCCLSHLHTRRGWRYKGVFERAPETGRLHFHGLLYVPDGEMVGAITEMTDYSTAQKRMQTRHENDFFQKTFGRNDFNELNENYLKHGQTLNYLLKYISKTDERIVYSHGIPTEIYCKLYDNDIVTTMEDYGTKYILWDNLLSWERDIMNFKFRQVNIADLYISPQRYGLVS